MASTFIHSYMLAAVMIDINIFGLVSVIFSSDHLKLLTSVGALSLLSLTHLVVETKLYVPSELIVMISSRVESQKEFEEAVEKIQYLKTANDTLEGSKAEILDKLEAVATRKQELEKVGLIQWYISKLFDILKSACLYWVWHEYKLHT